MSQIERPAQQAPPAADQPGLRPIERCVMNALEGGSGYPEIAARLRRTPDYVSRIEQLANIRLEMGSA